MQEDGEFGIVTKIETVKNDEGKTTLRATVEFYDGNCPALTFGTIWGKIPVKITEFRDNG